MTTRVCYITLQTRVSEGDQPVSGPSGSQPREGRGAVQPGRTDVCPGGTLGLRGAAEVPGEDVGGWRGQSDDQVSQEGGMERIIKFYVEKSLFFFNCQKWHVFIDFGSWNVRYFTVVMCNCLGNSELEFEKLKN